MPITGDSELHKKTEGVMWRVFRPDIFILLIKGRKYFLKTLVDYTPGSDPGYICLEGYAVPQYAEANISVLPLFILVFGWLGEWQQHKMKEYQESWKPCIWYK